MQTINFNVDKKLSHTVDYAGLKVKKSHDIKEGLITIVMAIILSFILCALFA